jgi:hypothetical protein
VPRPSQEAKDAAQRRKKVADKVSDTAVVASVVGLVPIAGHIVGIGATATGGLSWLCSKLLERIIKDPPRDDYFETTKLPPSRLNLAVLGNFPAEAATAALLAAMDHTNRAFEAMIVALERAGGAGENENEAMARERTEEVLAFALEASESMLASSELIGPFREVLREFEEWEPGPAYEPGTTLKSQLPRETVEMLDALGVPRAYLQTPLEPVQLDRPAKTFSDALAEAAQADYEFAMYLRTAVAEGTFLESGPEPERTGSASAAQPQ